MFHPIREDMKGEASAVMLDDRDERKGYAAQPCPNCHHAMVVHRRTGACFAGDCMCGWERRENGELFEKSTGLAASLMKIPGRKRKGKVAKKLRIELLKIPSYFCGGVSESMDHLQALSRGGTNQRENMVSACNLCNNMKSDRSYDEFIAYCKETVESLPFILRVPPTRHQIRAEHCRKVLTWHEARMKARQPAG